MNALDAAYGFDEDKAKGNWFILNGIKTKLAYMNHPEIEAKVQEKRNKKSEGLNRILTEEEHEEIGTDIFVNLVLLDWEIEDYPCTTENKLDAIKKYPKYLEDCFNVSRNNKKFQNKRIEETVKK